MTGQLTGVISAEIVTLHPRTLAAITNHTAMFQPLGCQVESSGRPSVSLSQVTLGWVAGVIAPEKKLDATTTGTLNRDLT